MYAIRSYYGSLRPISTTERGGFEPPVPCEHARFPSVDLKPLGHLSKETTKPFLPTKLKKNRLRGRPIGERGIRSPRARLARFVDPPRPLAAPSLAPIPPAGRRGLGSNPHRSSKGPLTRRSPHLLYGERGIRTPETLAGLTVFETARFNHSRISPSYNFV